VTKLHDYVEDELPEAHPLAFKDVLAGREDAK